MKYNNGKQTFEDFKSSDSMEVKHEYQRKRSRQNGGSHKSQGLRDDGGSQKAL